MSAHSTESAEKTYVIDGRIQTQYEKLTGYRIKGERLDRVKELPLVYLLKLAEELEHSVATATFLPSPSSTVESVYSLFREGLRGNT